MRTIQLRPCLNPTAVSKIYHIQVKYFIYLFIYFFAWLYSPGGPRTPPFEVSISHSDTPHSLEFLWANDRPFAENSTSHLKTLTRDQHSLADLEIGFPATGKPQTA